MGEGRGRKVEGLGGWSGCQAAPQRGPDLGLGPHSHPHLQLRAGPGGVAWGLSVRLL